MKLPALVIGIEWASPGYFAYSWEWWFSASMGEGECAKHLIVTVLGLTFAARLYAVG